MIGKKGFEVSIGFIVILILTIVIFVGSLYFLRQFYAATSEFEQEIGRETEAQIRSLIAEGKIVAIPINRAKSRVGQSLTFWLGIQNVLKSSDEFAFVVEFDQAFESDGVTPIKNYNHDFITENWVLYNPGPHQIRQGELETIPIMIVPGSNIDEDIRTVPGIYMFDVCVWDYENSLSLTNPPFGRCRDVNPRSVTPGNLYTEKVYQIFVEIQ